MKSIVKTTVMLFAAFALASGSAYAGSKGSKGSKGSDSYYKSSKGSKGSHGSKGSKGSKGSHGSKGSKGSKGSGDNGCECDGGITTLTLEYNGMAGTVTAYDKKGNTLFSGEVSDGGMFAVSGMDKKGKIGSKFFLNHPMGETEIHTSCSQPIEIGFDFGPFTVLAGASRNNGMLCGEVEQCPEPGPCQGLTEFDCCVQLTGNIEACMAPDG